MLLGHEWHFPFEAWEEPFSIYIIFGYSVGIDISWFCNRLNGISRAAKCQNISVTICFMIVENSFVMQNAKWPPFIYKIQEATCYYFPFFIIFSDFIFLFSR